MKSSLLANVVQSVQSGRKTFFRYITANDVGTTGSHQSGFYVPKEAASVLFEKLGTKGENMDRVAKIRWQGEFETESRFIYYGVGTRNEYRITRLGRNFPYLQEEYAGCLLVFTQYDYENYSAYVLENDEDIDNFFSHFNISPSTSSLILESSTADTKDELENRLLDIFLKRTQDFPSARLLAFWGEKFELVCNGVNKGYIVRHPDETIVAWVDKEFELFRLLEEKLYRPIYSSSFSSCEELIAFANTILNRRKSRAGRSLELHLERIFRYSQLQFSTQVITEGNKRPDFIFPSAEAYHNENFKDSELHFLAVKTTCKDRWRQILNEADRIHNKHLFTLQKGISKMQLDEMIKAGVTLVVPSAHLTTFDKSYRSRILTLSGFIELLRNQ